ncbi:MAG TPA: molecular chaperone TorD family protein [Candidatus Methylomirabilis sp.]|jgi:TorA maturation chaperone TorD
MIGDRDLLAFRRGYYDLFVSLLWREPDGVLLAGLAVGIEERIRVARQIHPLLGAGWEAIARFLDGADRDRLAEAVAEEYTRLFLGPRDPEVNAYESYYLTGRLWDRPLATLRGFLEEIGLERQEGYAEPEDCLAFELEVMRRLIARQGSAENGEGEARWLDLQATFLKRHLLVWAPAAARDLGQARGADFYRGAATLLQGFLEMERDLFLRWGPEELHSLEQARQRFAREKEWKGPLLDFGPAAGPAA